jgi:hypothetical protein
VLDLTPMGYEQVKELVDALPARVLSYVSRGEVASRGAG